MSESCSTIVGGDYQSAGRASRRLKEQLKQIGAAPDVIRRAMIAAYEAEMNAVIHGQGGTMTAVMDDQKVDVEVADAGPGIANMDLAMTEGYSTAPAWARELGFGAGMGLPNIKRNTDRFTLESTVGRGTRVCFTIFLRSSDAMGFGRNSIHIAADKCTRCLRCIHVCPTRANRVRESGPEILEYQCVDCTSCIDVCAAGALGVVGSADRLTPSAEAVLAVPPAFVAQFARRGGRDQVVAAMKSLGFAAVVVTEPAEAALRASVSKYAAGDARGMVVLSPVCPAVVNLIETKFPALIGNVAPFLSPLEAAREELVGKRATFVAICPAHRTLLGAGGGPAKTEIVVPAVLAAALLPLLGAGGGEAPADCSAAVGPASGEGKGRSEDGLTGTLQTVMQVTGMRHVVRVLEEIENGRMPGPGVLELFACDEGCFGSPLLKEDPFVSRQSWRRATAPSGQSGAATRRKIGLRARPGLRLDRNMARAIEKLARIDATLKSLPGQDCGMCGCPTCAALAEDIVLGRAAKTACRRLFGNQGNTP